MTSVPAPERVRGGYVYGLYALDDPQKTVRYVGKTVQKPAQRFRAHAFNARNGAQTPVAKWMRKHDLRVGQVVLDELPDYQSLCAAEMRLIAEHGTLTTEGGLNCTGGGDGSIGWVHGPEVIEKIRQKALGRKPSPESIRKAVAARAGYVVSQETRAKQSAARLGRKPSPHHLAALREARKAFRGEGNPQAKLTDEIVSKVKARLWDGIPQRDIITELGVTQSIVSGIARGRAWTHVPWPNDRPRVAAPTAAEIRAVVPDDVVREIRRLYDDGVPRRQIAMRLDVSEAQVYRIGKRERYTHIL